MTAAFCIWAVNRFLSLGCVFEWVKHIVKVFVLTALFFHLCFTIGLNAPQNPFFIIPKLEIDKMGDRSYAVSYAVSRGFEGLAVFMFSCLLLAEFVRLGIQFARETREEYREYVEMKRIYDKNARVSDIHSTLLQV
jgi:type III secretory pathway component EscU